MDLDAPTPLLGGLSPAHFMRRHWQKKPMLVRQAWPGVVAPLERPALFGLAAREDVESRLVLRTDRGWRLRHGPLGRRALPPLHQPAWTLLVQGLDLHVPAAGEMLRRFAFIPHARLDDLMVSWASDGGGVGPHLDSYDVFLIQLQGRRRWRVGRVRDPAWQDGQPLKILRHFEPEHDWLLEPGDMLYLPPNWGHDGVAEGACMTASVGFRAPAGDEVARELLSRLADAPGPEAGPRYADPGQPPVAHPGRVPAQLADFAARALARALRSGDAVPRALGEWLSEPKPQVWFDAGTAPARRGAGVRLDARTRMLYDARHVYVNGESWRAGGHDARVLRRLADRREIDAGQRARLGADAGAVLDEWIAAGWLQEDAE